MSAMIMQILGYILLGGGVVFFIVSQILLNRWQQSYEAEIGQM
ncbi:MAG: hypothetical protein Q4C02_01575 [Eubacteriales bacterium]|nr:hypothetical protein [Eubacteriales bacterium]